MSDRVCIVVTGSRHLTFERHGDAIADALEAAIPASADHVILLHGDQRGADHLCRDTFRIICATRGSITRCDHWPLPYFEDYGSGDGGKDRNKCLADVAAVLQRNGYQVRPLAFPAPDSRGTWNAVRCFKSVGLPEPKVLRQP